MNRAFAVILILICVTFGRMAYKEIPGISTTPQVDCGYVQNNSNERVSLSRAQVPLKLYFDANFPTQYYADVKAAIATWEKAIGHKVFELQPQPLPASSPSQDGRSVIYWMSNWDTSIENQQGNTTIYWDGATITEADIRIDALYYAFSDSPGNTQVDMQSLLLHELGHALGFKHDDSNQSVMATYLGSSFERRNLYATDLTRLQCEYATLPVNPRKLALTQPFRF